MNPLIRSAIQSFLSDPKTSITGIASAIMAGHILTLDTPTTLPQLWEITRELAIAVILVAVGNHWAKDKGNTTSTQSGDSTKDGSEDATKTVG